MKVRKLKGEYDPDTTAMYRMIVALKEARTVSAAHRDPGEFQNRCGDAILALATRLLERVEANYEPETRKFRVTFDVKRSGTATIVVEAKDEAEARAVAQSNLSKTAGVHFDEVPTEVVATDVVEAKEVPDGLA